MVPPGTMGLAQQSSPWHSVPVRFAQERLHADASPTLQTNPSSTAHEALQPSAPRVLPSSHASPGSRTPLPHTATPAPPAWPATPLGFVPAAPPPSPPAPTGAPAPDAPPTPSGRQRSATGSQVQPGAHGQLVTSVMGLSFAQPPPTTRTTTASSGNAAQMARA